MYIKEYDNVMGNFHRLLLDGKRIHYTHLKLKINTVTTK